MYGSVRGAPGDRRSYRDRLLGEWKQAEFKEITENSTLWSQVEALLPPKEIDDKQLNLSVLDLLKKGLGGGDSDEYSVDIHDFKEGIIRSISTRDIKGIKEKVELCALSARRYLFKSNIYDMPNFPRFKTDYLVNFLASLGLFQEAELDPKVFYKAKLDAGSISQEAYDRMISYYHFAMVSSLDDLLIEEAPSPA
jgi:hypothetical protein